MDFANLITKKMSLMVCAHILPEDKEGDIPKLKSAVSSWLKMHNIKSFYSVSSDESFSRGVKSAILLSGLGKLSPNMILLGFNDKKDNLSDIEEYYNAITIAFEQKMAVGILRVKHGLDYSSVICSEESTAIDESEEESKPSKKKMSKKEKEIESTFRGQNGKLLPKNIIDDIQQFKVKRRTGTIDVWWLYDDGGLTILLPHILQTRDGNL